MVAVHPSRPAQRERGHLRMTGRANAVSTHLIDVIDAGLPADQTARRDDRSPAKPSLPRIDRDVDRSRLALTADGVQRLVDLGERKDVRTHPVERVFAAGNDPQGELDTLVAVAAHAFDGEEAG